MTAVPDWDIVDPRNTDAELVCGSLAGDRTAFAQIYDRYADRLHDFCVGMLRDRDSAADCVQDTFCLAATRLPQLREPDKLRPWLYSIARNEALRRLRERRRETLSDELPDIQSEDDGPDTLAARTELAEMIAEAAGGLSDRDRAVFDLAFRHGLNGPDLAGALGVSHANANAHCWWLAAHEANRVNAQSWTRCLRTGTGTSPCSCANACRAISSRVPTATTNDAEWSAPPHCSARHRSSFPRRIGCAKGHWAKSSSPPMAVAWEATKAAHHSPTAPAHDDAAAGGCCRPCCFSPCWARLLG
jgi:RNA polymerase sigma factor (sigma-70 family)